MLLLGVITSPDTLMSSAPSMHFPDKYQHLSLSFPDPARISYLAATMSQRLESVLVRLQAPIKSVELAQSVSSSSAL